MNKSLKTLAVITLSLVAFTAAIASTTTLRIEIGTPSGGGGGGGGDVHTQHHLRIYASPEYWYGGGIPVTVRLHNPGATYTTRTLLMNSQGYADTWLSGHTGALYVTCEGYSQIVTKSNTVTLPSQASGQVIHLQCGNDIKSGDVLLPHDNAINALDLSAIMSNLHTNNLNRDFNIYEAGTVNYNAGDLSGDTVTNALDLSYVIRNINEHGYEF